MRYLPLLLSLVFSSAALAADAAIRPNGLIFNQTYPLVVGEATKLPLYLTRRGEYYAEIILERPEAGQPRDRVGFDINVQIDRNEKVLFERALSTKLDNERPIATLFWLTSDREVPIKTPLTLALEISGVDEGVGDETVRVQIKRKKNFGLRQR